MERRACRTVLMVDEDPKLLQAAARALAEQGYDVVTCAGRSVPRRILRELRPDLMVLGSAFRDAGGREELRKAREDACALDVPVLILSERDEVRLRRLAARPPAYDVFADRAVDRCSGPSSLSPAGSLGDFEKR